MSQLEQTIVFIRAAIQMKDTGRGGEEWRKKGRQPSFELLPLNVHSGRPWKFLGCRDLEGLLDCGSTIIQNLVHLLGLLALRPLPICHSHDLPGLLFLPGPFPEPHVALFLCMYEFIPS